MAAEIGYTVRELLGSAVVYANEAIHDYERERWELFPLHAGAATEFLAKAALADIDPLLLADSGGNLGKTLAQLAGIDAQDQAEIRTVGLSEAVTRLRLKYADLGVKDEQVRMIVKARNAAAHMGAAGMSGNDLLYAFVCTCTALLKRCRQHPAKFWKEYESATRIIAQLNPRDEQFNGRARLALARCRSKLTSEAGVMKARAEAAESSLMGDHQEAADCPVCGCRAIFDGDDEPMGEVWVFVPTASVCHGCELRLHQADALALDPAELGNAFAPRPTSRAVTELVGQRGLWRETT